MAGELFDNPNQECVRADSSGPGIDVQTPTLTGLNPASSTVGSGMFTVTATGTLFDTWTALTWGGVDYPTTFLSATQVSASVPKRSTAVNVPVTVRNGNEPSNTVQFPFTPVAGGSTETAATADTFDPAKFIAADVRAYVEAHPEERGAVLESELNGRNRSTLVEWLQSG